MAINFPNTPADGQVFVDPNGAEWRYQTATNSWTSKAADPAAIADATEAVKGIVQLATAAETTTGTDATKAVHSAGLKVELDKKANQATTYTKTEVDTSLAAKLNKAGDVATGSITTPERTITAADFDLATGPYWTCDAIAVPNPTNAVAGMSGLIRLTAAPTSWAGNFKHAGGAAPTIAAFPAIVPFYVSGASTILCGKPVEGMA
jgi:hypothetical protein